MWLELVRTTGMLLFDSWQQCSPLFPAAIILHSIFVTTHIGVWFDLIITKITKRNFSCNSCSLEFHSRYFTQAWSIKAILSEQVDIQWAYSIYHGHGRNLSGGTTWEETQKRKWVTQKHIIICLRCLYGQKTANKQPKQKANDLKGYKEWLNSP